MTNKDWDDIPYADGDCIRDENEWNDMVEYIRHSACTDFTIYGTCPNTDQAFRLTKDGAISVIYGGADSGDDMIIHCNDSNLRPRIIMYGDSDIHLDTADEVYFDQAGTQMLLVDYDTNVTTVEGGAAAGDDLWLAAGSGQVYPYIRLYGNSGMNLYVAGGSDFRLHDITTEELRIGYAANVTTLEGGAVTGDDLILKANSNDTYPYILLEGNDDVEIYYAGTQCMKIFNGATEAYRFSYAANVSTFRGGAVSGDDLIVKANSSNDYPYIELKGNDDMSLYVPTSQDIFFYTGTSNMFKFYYGGSESYLQGGGNADENLRIRANQSDSYPVLFLDGGNENIQINDTTPLSAHFDLALLGDGVLCIKETATPTADTNYGKIYCKNDNHLYFQDGAGVEHQVV